MSLFQPDVVVSPKGGMETAPAPINPGWVLAGSPQARSAVLSRSPDSDAVTVLWECTAGSFNWRFEADETVHIIGGAVSVLWKGQRHTLSVGDTCYFPAGTEAIWVVHTEVRKIAFIRTPAPLPVSLGLRVWRKIVRTFAGGTPAAGALQPQTN